MLHDPKWNHGTLAGLITWLEGQDPTGTYNFANCEQCLIGRYMTGVERARWPVEMLAIYAGHDLHKIARGTDLFQLTLTYGSALERAYAAQAALVA
jgi:hypothetical protein